MTTTATRPPATGGAPSPGLGNLIRSELLKIRTTNVWWTFLIGAFFATGLALTVWILVGNDQINNAEAARGEPFAPSEEALENEELLAIELQEWELSQDITRTLHDAMAEIYTSGQFFGLMFAMLLGALLVTNEFHHQTATATFLTTPRRSKVILGKLATAMLAAAFFWVFSTVLSIAAGAIFISIKGYGLQLGEWPVLRAILLNGLAYGLWGILGIGIGVLIRSQIAAVVVASIGYLIGTFLFQNVIIPLLYFLLGWEWVLDVSVLWPAIASQIMISPEPIFPGTPDWWVGGLVLVGYGLLFGGIGTIITRRRDIS
jgi:ABC-2 type transport system permease protein